MKKLLFTISVLLLFVIVTKAQAPAFFNYQGVARNSVGNALVNKSIRLRLTIHDGSATGIPVYTETRSLITNAFGLFNVQVGGAGATNVSGTIAGSNWNTGTKWLQVEIDPEGGTSFKDIGTTQLTSVPYSLFTTQSGDIVLPFVKTQNEETPLFRVTNSGNNANSLSFEGVSNSTANNATAVRGLITSVAPGVFSAGVIGQNNGTSGNGVGVYGTQNGTGYGVYGTTPGGVGVYGNSTSGMGVYGQSVTGPSVMGFQPNTGTSNAGSFQNTSTTNTAAALRVQTNGIGEGLNITATGLGKGQVVAINNAASGNNVLEVSTNGTGKVALLQNTNAANASNVLDVTTNGTGRAAALQNTNAANASNVLDVSTNGLGRAALFVNTNAANTAPTVSIVSNAPGDGLQSLMTGTGKPGLFNINNAANANFAIDASSNGTNNVINSLNTGLGRAGFFQVNNAASTADALSAVTNGVGASWAIRGTSSGTNGAGLFIQNNAANTANNLQSNQAGLGRAALFNATNATNAANAMEVTTAGIGRAAFFNATNAANAANALEVNMAGTGFAASFTSTNAAPKALRTAGAISFTGVGEGPARVMATVDGSGNATWQNAASVGLVSGSGTTNFVPRWTPDGTIIGNSQIFDNGTNMSISGAIDANYKMALNGKFKVTAAVNDTAVALFENTGTGANSDGIVIKLGRTHPRWNGSAYANVTNPVTQGVETQINQVRDWIYGNDSFSWDDLINLMPSQYLVGTVCNLTNLISEKINTGIGLPLNISTPINNGIGLPFNVSGPINSGLGLPYNISGPINSGLGLPVRFSILDIVNQACDICVDDDDVPGSYFDLIPALPALTIPAIPAFTIPAIPSFSIPAIPQINCAGLPTLAFPVFVFNDVSNTLSKENEYIAFVDKDNRKLGAIRAQSIQNFSYDYFDGQKLLELVSEFVGIDIVKDFLSIVSGVSGMVGDYNNIGVEYSSGNGDYAEWLERSNPKEDISFGDIVAVKGGKITKDMAGAEQIMAVSKKPIVLGNMPEASKTGLGNNIAFMGQIPVKVIGAVQSGDYIVAKGDVPGYGTAVHPKDMKVEDFKLAVGRSWDSNLKDGPKMVNTVVGVHNHDFLNIIGGLQKKAERTDERLKAIESLLNVKGNTDTKSEQPKKAFK
jgi:hypothetical protein